MASEKRYHADDLMSEMVECNYRVLLILSRFGIGLGFGERSIGEVCEAAGVDVDTFLAIVNIALESPTRSVVESTKPIPVGENDAQVDPEVLLKYLMDSHKFYLRVNLPEIRRLLIEVWQAPEDDLYLVMLRYFDEFVAHIAEHSRWEEEKIFPYFRALTKGRQIDRSCERHLGEHLQMHNQLRELRGILVNYYTQVDTAGMYEVLARLCICEWDLATHARVEAMLMEAMIARMEEKFETAQV